jgi:hypothetical protein
MVSQPYGFTWTGGLYKGKINNNTWYQQSVYGLDFDKGIISVDQVVDRLKDFNITPQIWYSSFSDTPSLRKFRVVIFSDEPAVNEYQRKYIMDGLLSLFPESDQQCKNAGRFFFGGLKSEVLSMDPIPLKKLVDALGVNMIALDGGRTRKVKSLFTGKTAETGHFYIIYIRTTGFCQIIIKVQL